jgi:hypothetical protein
VLQPIEQVKTQVPQHAELRKMRVRVDKTRQQKAAAQIGDRDVRMRSLNRGVVACRNHFAAMNQQSSIPVGFETRLLQKRILWRMKQGRPQQFTTVRSTYGLNVRHTSDNALTKRSAQRSWPAASSTSSCRNST